MSTRKIDWWYQKKKTKKNDKNQLVSVTNMIQYFNYFYLDTTSTQSTKYSTLGWKIFSLFLLNSFQVKIVTSHRLFDWIVLLSKFSIPFSRINDNYGHCWMVWGCWRHNEFQIIKFDIESELLDTWTFSWFVTIIEFGFGNKFSASNEKTPELSSKARRLMIIHIPQVCITFHWVFVSFRIPVHCSAWAYTALRG